MSGATELDLADLPATLASLSLAGVDAPDAEVAQLVARCSALVHLDLAENERVSDLLWEDPALAAAGVSLTAVGAYRTELRAAPQPRSLNRFR